MTDQLDQDRIAIGHCPHYCSHGGVCSLGLNHGGQHSASGACAWTDEESISKERADQLFAEKDALMPSWERSVSRMLGLPQKES